MTKQEQLTAKQRELEELEAKQAELKAEIEELEKGWRWVPGFNKRYSYITASGATFNDEWTNHPFDHFRLSVGNVFRLNDEEGAEDHKLFWQSLVPSCAYADATHFVGMDGNFYPRREHDEFDSMRNYLLGRGFDSLEKAEKWKALYHEVQLRKCGG